MNNFTLKDLENIIEKRKILKDESYTALLLNSPVEKTIKIGEESAELICD